MVLGQFVQRAVGIAHHSQCMHPVEVLQRRQILHLFRIGLPLGRKGIEGGQIHCSFHIHGLFAAQLQLIAKVILAGLGYLLYRVVPDDSQFFAQLEHYNHYLKIAGFVLLGAVILYIIYKVYKKKNNKSQEL